MTPPSKPENSAPSDPPEPAAEAAVPTLRKIEFIASGTHPRHFPTDGLPQVAFVGRSNVGKSSLLNMLANRRQLAHVSRTPGRTQLVNFFKINDAGYLVDLPGYGFALAPKSVKETWDKMMTSYLTGNPYLKGVILLLDSRRDGPTADDTAMMEWLDHYHVPITAVLTKCDKLKRNELSKARKTFYAALTNSPVVRMLETSAQEKSGRDDLLREVFTILWGGVDNLKESDTPPDGLPEQP